KTMGLEFPARRDDLLITLLGRALELVPPQKAEAMAEAVGIEYGQALAASMAPGDGHRSFQAALHAVADALTAHGFAAHAEARPGSLAIIAEQCPFGDAAVQHPVICAAERGSHMVCPVVEHSAVRDAAARYDVTWIGVDHLGRVDADEVVAALRPDTALVNLQWGNHEVATLQPVAAVVAECRERGVLV